MTLPPDLLATCWTSAGDVVPARNGGVSPHSVEERIQAAARAGYRGFGIAAPDLEVVRATIGYPAMARLLGDEGIRYVEVEYLEDWWTQGDRRRASDEVRAVLLEAAAELGADHVKVGLGHREEDHDEGRFAEEFDRLANDAGTHGTRIALEPPADSMMGTIAPPPSSCARSPTPPAACSSTSGTSSAAGRPTRNSSRCSRRSTCSRSR